MWDKSQNFQYHGPLSLPIHPKDTRRCQYEKGLTKFVVVASWRLKVYVFIGNLISQNFQNLLIPDQGITLWQLSVPDRSLYTFRGPEFLMITISGFKDVGILEL